MRIVIDARALRWAGIGRYTSSLLTALHAEKSSHDFVALVAAADKQHLVDLSQTWPKPLAAIQVVEGSYYSWQEQTIFWRQLQSIKADLFHFTHFNVPSLFRRPYVVTIHDVTRFIFPGERRQNLGQQIMYEQVFARAIKQARSIISVSRTTANALKSLPIKIAAPITTLYEGVDLLFSQPIDLVIRQKVRLHIGTNDRYFLFVGVWMSHKNIWRLLEAFAQVIKQHPTVKLVLTGKPKPGYSNVLKYVQELHLAKHVIFAGFVPSHLLPALYAEAQALVFPSLYEGFGLPPLEALAAGTPVISSNVSSMPEILSDQALYVNPEYVPSITEAMEYVLNQPEYAEQGKAARQAHAAQFTWPKAAQEHLTVYKNTLKSL